MLYLRNISFSGISGSILARRLLSACVRVRFSSTVRFGSGSVCHAVRVRTVRFVLLKDVGSSSVRSVRFSSLAYSTVMLLHSWLT